MRAALEMDLGQLRAKVSSFLNLKQLFRLQSSQSPGRVIDQRRAPTTTCEERPHFWAKTFMLAGLRTRLAPRPRGVSPPDTRHLRPASEQGDACQTD